MIETKKVVIRKSPLFPVYIVAAAIALMIAANVLSVAGNAETAEQNTITGF